MKEKYTSVNNTAFDPQSKNNKGNTKYNLSSHKNNRKKKKRNVVILFIPTKPNEIEDNLRHTK